VELEQAERSLRSGRILLTDGDTDGTINRLYYALYHAARAALADASVEIPKSHAGLISAFGTNFVKTGKISPSLGKLLNRLEHKRLIADYSGDEADPKELPELIAQSQLFLSAVRALIAKPQR
jgi:uncharacterized protein (UPF0332 family)